MAFQLRQKAERKGLAPIHKFTKVGEQIEGVYKGVHQGKQGYRPLVAIGDVVITQTAQIEQYFADIPEGSYVWVTFQGKVAFKDKTVNNFDVEFALPEGAATPEAVKAATEEYTALAAQLPEPIRRAVEGMFQDPAARLERVKQILAEKK